MQGAGVEKGRVKGAGLTKEQRKIVKLRQQDPCKVIPLSLLKQAIEHDSKACSQACTSEEAKAALERLQYQLLNESGKGFIFLGVDEKEDQHHMERLFRAHRREGGEKEANAKTLYKSGTKGCDQAAFHFLDDLCRNLLKAAPWGLRHAHHCPPIDLVEDLLPPQSSSDGIITSGRSGDGEGRNNYGILGSWIDRQESSRSLLQLQSRNGDGIDDYPGNAEVDVGILSMACLMNAEGSCPGLQVRNWENDWVTPAPFTTSTLSASLSGSGAKYFLAVSVGRTLERATAGLFMAIARRFVIRKPVVDQASPLVSMVFSLRARPDAWLNPFALSERLQVALPCLEYTETTRPIMVVDYEDEIEGPVKDDDGEEEGYQMEERPAAIATATVATAALEPVSVGIAGTKEGKQNGSGSEKEEEKKEETVVVTSVTVSMEVDDGQEEEREIDRTAKLVDAAVVMDTATTEGKEGGMGNGKEIEVDQQQNQMEESTAREGVAAAAASSFHTTVSLTTPRTEEEEKRETSMKLQEADNDAIRKIFDILPAATAAIAAATLKERTSPSCSPTPPSAQAVADRKVISVSREEGGEETEEEEGEKEAQHSSICFSGASGMILQKASVTTTTTTTAAASTIVDMTLKDGHEGEEKERPQQQQKQQQQAAQPSLSSTAAAATLPTSHALPFIINTSSLAVALAEEGGQDEEEEQRDQHREEGRGKDRGQVRGVAPEGDDDRNMVNEVEEERERERPMQLEKERGLPPQQQKLNANGSSSSASSSSSTTSSTSSAAVDHPTAAAASHPPATTVGQKRLTSPANSSSKKRKSTSSSSSLEAAAAAAKTKTASKSSSVRNVGSGGTYMIKVQGEKLDKTIGLMVRGGTLVEKMAFGLSNRFRRLKKIIPSDRFSFTKDGRALDKGKTMQQEGLEHGMTVICKIDHQF